MHVLAQACKVSSQMKILAVFSGTIIEVFINKKFLLKRNVVCVAIFTQMFLEKCMAICNK